MKVTQAVEHVKTLDIDRIGRYEQYFSTLVPETVEDIFRRWLFAYASVHTTWEYNCKLYNALKDLTWLGNEALLLKRIRDSRAGFHNQRTRFLTEFSDFYWKHPTWFNKTSREDWFQYRNRIMAKALGIGRAKAAFLIELVYFQDAGIACFDTHMVQLYGYTAKQYASAKISKKTLDAMEQHWSKLCRKNKVSPVTARWIFWDTKQKKEDSRYWSWVLEETNHDHAELERAASPAQERAAYLPGYRQQARARTADPLLALRKTIHHAQALRCA